MVYNVQEQYLKVHSAVMGWSRVDWGSLRNIWLYFGKQIPKFYWSSLKYVFRVFNLKNVLLEDGFQIYPVYTHILLPGRIMVIADQFSS